MENVYTEEMIAEMKQIGEFNNDIALDFADRHNLSVASVRAKAGRMEGVGYARKPRTTKNGDPVESKADIVAEIAEALDSDAESFESLGNATKLVLQRVRDALTSE